MHWQLELTHPPRQIHILGNQLAVREHRQKMRFYELETGAPYHEVDLNFSLLDKNPEARRERLSQLQAPNGLFLPTVELLDCTLHISVDGDLRLIQHNDLNLEIDDQMLRLDVPSDKAQVALATLDRELGSIAVVTEDAVLHIFQQQTPVNRLFLEATPVVKVFIKMGGSEIIVVYLDKIAVLDSAGRRLFQAELAYRVGAAALSSDGEWLLLADADSQVIRLYDCALVLVRQESAMNLVKSARPLQLFGELPAQDAAVSAIDVHEGGVVAFGLGKTLCVAPIEAMAALPQPRLLF